MPTDHRSILAKVKRFDQLIAYLRDEMGWPIARDSFDDVDDLFYDFTPEELGIDEKNAAKIQEIKRLRPLSTNQPWGIFFVKFEPKKLPVVALRRLLSQVALKNRASANSAERAAWSPDDLLFVSNYGEGDTRQISFAHFSQSDEKRDLPTLKVLGWDNRDTALHLDRVAELLKERLSWPADEEDVEGWGKQWRSAFTLSHREVIHTSKKLSVELAALARSIRERINIVLSIETERGPVSQLMAAFKQALVHDLDEDGFADMYAQTIAYGLLSARVSNPSGDTADEIAGSMPVTNPFLKELMETFLAVGGRNGKAGHEAGLDFDELGVADVVELLDAANMEAVIRDFGDKNPEEDPVIHFYELFLKEYDAQKRMQRGVFYTPRPVVSFIVRRVDEVLRTEFELEDGLADTTTWGEMLERFPHLEVPESATPDEGFVQILDPATGTGTFLVEVIDLIHRTLRDKWTAEGCNARKVEERWNDYVPRHLLPRLHGYELMMAPYAIAHMKIGLKLYETGYLFESDERARVYLTNALEPPHDFSGTLAFAIPALAHESEAVNAVKRGQRFTVVIGNPPYSGHSANPSRRSDNSLTFIGRLMEDYKEGCPELYKPAQAKWLQDDYVKFLRFAEEVLRGSPCRVLGYITNHSYLNNPTFRGMRRHLCETFESLRFIDLHGNIKRAQSGKPGKKDENVFDIQQGVAIQLSHSGGQADSSLRVLHGDLRGTRAEKYKALTLGKPQATERIHPTAPLMLFVPRDEELLPEYERGWRVPEIMGVAGDPAPGIVSTHDQFAFGFTEGEVFANVEALLATKSEKEARGIFRLCSQSQWDYATAKADLADGSWKNKPLAVLYRPFDVRFTINDSNVAVHRRERVLRHMTGMTNLALCTDRQVNGEFRHVFCSRTMVNDCALSTASKERTYILPLYLVPAKAGLGLEGEARPNLSESFLRALSGALGREASEPFGLPSGVSPEDIFAYCYCILHSPTYRKRYAEFLKTDFPRVSLPGEIELFRKLSKLGHQLVELHLLERHPELTTTLVGSAEFQVEKVSYSDETVWLDRAKTQGFRGVPPAVWNFHIGGYQVCAKWLKDRQAKGGKTPRPGLVLSKDDLNHYQRIVAALTGTIRVMSDIDEVIESSGGWPTVFDGDGVPCQGEPEQLAMVAESEPSYGDGA